MVIDQNYIKTWKISGCVLRGRSRCAGMMRRWNGQSVCPPRPSWHSELEDVDSKSLRENKDAGSVWCGFWENRIKKNFTDLLCWEFKVLLFTDWQLLHYDFKLYEHSNDSRCLTTADSMKRWNIAVPHVPCDEFCSQRQVESSLCVEFSWSFP